MRRLTRPVAGSDYWLKAPPRRYIGERVWHAGLMALMITLMGFCGGLVMSAIKRDRGVKDWAR